MKKIWYLNVGILSLATSLMLLAVPAVSAKPNPRLKAEFGLSLPRGAVTVVVGKDRYHYHKGIYYQKTARGYTVVQGPRGGVIRTLPRGYVRVVSKGKTYYRYNGVYYQSAPNGFVIVADPTLAPVQVTPEQPPAIIAVEEGSRGFVVWLNGQEILFKEGQFFKPGSDSLTWVNTPYGAYCEVLPAGAVTVWYQESEYFEIDGVHFKRAPEGYRVVLPPWQNS